MTLALLLTFGSGLLVGYALFVDRSGAAVSGVPKVSPARASSASKTVGGALNKKPPAAGAAIAAGTPTLMKRIQAVFSGKPAPASQSAAAARASSQPPPPGATLMPAPAGSSGEESKNRGAATAGSGATAAAPPPEEYCLQLGAFTNLKLAQQLQATLKEKGYSAIIFEGVDVGYKRWHAVRISQYPDLDSATKAAADFTAKEKVQAIVRPSGQL